MPTAYLASILEVATEFYFLLDHDTNEYPRN